MSLIERDSYSGYTATGHEWNGIKELNAPILRIVLWFLAVTHIYAVIIWVVYPAWPLVWVYTKGLLGGDQQTAVETRIALADAARSDWVNAIATEDLDRVPATPTLWPSPWSRSS
jgi:cytochrome c oxidase cbb3-type subunit 3